MPADSLSETDADETSSVDDFIRQLEEKEKDLHITSDLRIEVEDSDFDGNNVPDIVLADLAHSNVGTATQGSASAASKVRNFELENEVATLKVRVMELKAERHDIQEKSDRRLKDFENFKYRMDRERRGSFIDQIGNLQQSLAQVWFISEALVQTSYWSCKFRWQFSVHELL